MLILIYYTKSFSYNSYTHYLNTQYCFLIFFIIYFILYYYYLFIFLIHLIYFIILNILEYSIVPCWHASMKIVNLVARLSKIITRNLHNRSKFYYNQFYVSYAAENLLNAISVILNKKALCWEKKKRWDERRGKKMYL